VLFAPKGTKYGNKSSAPRKLYDETFKEKKERGGNKYDDGKKEDKTKKTNEEFYNKGNKGGK